jgi:hypothetical protein
MSTDAIVMLKNDHKEIRALFKQFEDLARTLVCKHSHPAVTCGVSVLAPGL